MIERFNKVNSLLYRGGAPNSVDVIMLKEKHDINKIVSLDEDCGIKIQDICKKLKIEHNIIPIDWTKSSLIKLLSHDFKKLFLENGPTFVHCFQGKDRTGLVVALIKCKYFGNSPEEALEDAKSLDFGIGLLPETVKFYESIIKACKKEDENNATDIVLNQRDNFDDSRSSILDEAGQQGSFAPHLDQTKTEIVYRNTEDQSPTRENFQEYRSVENKDSKSSIPTVGIYNNDAGLYGAGPCFPSGGFLTD